MNSHPEMTTSYEISMKLHQKYPELGKDSYWVWDDVWIESSPGYKLTTRKQFEYKIAEFDELKDVVPIPALTLGGLVRELAGNGFRYVQIFTKQNDFAAFFSPTWQSKQQTGAIGLTPEDALAAALLEAQ